MSKLQECIKINKVNQSHSRELIYKIISDNEECLNVSEIINLIDKEYPKKISINTVYRHLRFLLECKLIFIIQDDLKKAYYCLCRDEIDIFEVCPICKNIKKIDIEICESMKKSDFITLHKKCKNCL